MGFTLRSSVRLLAAFGWISFASGCRTLSLQIETPGDLSRYRTWNFVQPVRAGDDDASARAGIDLEPVFATSVESALANRGFPRTARDPELLVYPRLAVREQLVQQNVTGATQYLPSLDHTPSYDVQATRTELRRYEIAELLVLMIDSSDHRLVWRGRLVDRYLGEFAPHLEEAVSQLLADVPAPRPSTDARTVIVQGGSRPFPFP